MAAGDEPLLEREGARLGVDPRAEEVVGRGQDRGLDAERARELRRHLGERPARAQRLGPDKVEADVAVAEPEPRLAAERADRVERVPGLVRSAPAALLVVQSRERVQDAVEVGRDVHAEHLEVVADVSDHRDVGRRDALDDGAREPAAAHTSREDDGLHATGARPAMASAICVRGPVRSS